MRTDPKSGVVEALQAPDGMNRSTTCFGIAFWLSFGVCAAGTSSELPIARAEELDWDSFGFSLNGVETDAMWVQVWTEAGGWEKGALYRRGRLALDPASTALNYGQGIFEGLKAKRYSRGDDSEDDETIALFRPDANAKRMNEGCRRLGLPEVDEEAFVAAAAATALANSRWVPPRGKGALYLRPVLFGSGAKLGVGPSPEVTLVIFASPVNTYFKGSTERPISLLVQDNYHRATEGGAGGIKFAGNYAPTFMGSRLAKKHGADEILYLDSKADRFAEEVGASNFFAVLKVSKHQERGGDEALLERGALLRVDGDEKFSAFKLRTPSTRRGTILDGVTRRSILDLAKYVLQIDACEADLALEDVLRCQEAFCSGTGAVVTPVGRFRRRFGEAAGFKDGGDIDEEIVLPHDERPGPLTVRLKALLTGIQSGALEDVFGWVVDARKVVTEEALPSQYVRQVTSGAIKGWRECWPAFSYKIP